MRKLFVPILTLALGLLTAGCQCDLCCSTRVPPDPCAPCAPAAVAPATAPALAPAVEAQAAETPPAAPARP